MIYCLQLSEQHQDITSSTPESSNQFEYQAFLSSFFQKRQLRPYFFFHGEVTIPLLWASIIYQKFLHILRSHLIFKLRLENSVSYICLRSGRRIYTFSENAEGAYIRFSILFSFIAYELLENVKQPMALCQIESKRS